MSSSEEWSDNNTPARSQPSESTLRLQAAARQAGLMESSEEDVEYASSNRSSNRSHESADALSDGGSVVVVEDAGRARALSIAPLCQRCALREPMDQSNLCVNCVAKEQRKARKAAAKRAAEKDQDFVDAATMRRLKRSREVKEHKASRCVWFCAGVFVNYPVCVLLAAMFLPVVFLLASTLFSIELETGGFTVRDELIPNRFDAVRFAQNATYYSENDLMEQEVPEVQTQVAFAVTLVFEGLQGASVFRADNVRKMKKIADGIAALPEYKTRCLLREVIDFDKVEKGELAEDGELPKKKVCAFPTGLLQAFFPSEYNIPVTLASKFQGLMAPGGSGQMMMMMGAQPNGMGALPRGMGMPNTTMVGGARKRQAPGPAPGPGPAPASAPAPGPAPASSPASSPAPAPSVPTFKLMIPDGRGEDLVEPTETTLKNLWEATELSVFPFVDKDFDTFNYASSVTRLQFFFGLPYKGYDDVTDPEQSSSFDAWAVDADIGFLDLLDSFEDDNMALYYYGAGVSDINALIVTDGALSLAAILFVAAYMFFHTGSCCLTCAGMTHIMMSLPVTFFFFRAIVGVEKISMLLVLSIFILLGIGADDCFIVLDTWKQSRVVSESVSKSMQSRMAWSWERAVKTMAITSITTSAAFFANGISSIPPIRLFGLFTGVLVVVNFLLVITWYPAAVVLWSRWFEQRKLRCCAGGMCDDETDEDEENDQKKKKKKDQSWNDIEMGELTPEEKKKRKKELKKQRKAEEKNAKRFSEGTLRNLRVKLGLKEEKKKGEPDGEENGLDIGSFRPMERFFYSTFTPLLNAHKLKILIVFFIGMIVFTVFAVQLEAASEPAQFLPDDFPMQKALNLERDDFKETDFVSKMGFVWGLTPINRDGTNSYDSEDLGTVDFDERIQTAWTPAAQLYILDVCAQLRDLDSVRRREVLCFMEDFQRWLEGSASNSTSDSSSNAPSSAPSGAGVFPVPTSEEFVTLLRQFTTEFEEVTAGRGSTGRVSGGVSLGRRQTVMFDRETKELRGVIVVANTTMPRFLPASKARVEFEEWTALADDLRDQGPDSLDTMFFVNSGQRFVRMRTEEELQTGAYTGIGVSILLAFVVLLFSTLNVMIAGFAIISVAGIVVTFLGFVVMIGWTLGIIESICITILVGLAVDYVVHLANAYNDSEEETRYGKTRQALTELGISVLSAAMTTLGASVLLLFTTVIFFFRFGLFVAMTIAASTLFAFVFFIALVLTVGPVRQQGDLKPAFHWISGKFKHD